MALYAKDVWRLRTEGKSLGEIASETNYSYSHVSKLSAEGRRLARLAEERRQADDQKRQDFKRDAEGEWGVDPYVPAKEALAALQDLPVTSWHAVPDTGW